MFRKIFYKLSAVFGVFAFIGCGLSLHFVAIKDESPFYSKYKSKISKIGITRFTRNPDNPCSIIHIGYARSNVKGYNVSDTIQNILKRVYDGDDKIKFLKEMQLHVNKVNNPDSNLIQFTSIIINEGAFDKSIDELSALCDKYNIDALIVGEYRYCVESKNGEVRSYGEDRMSKDFDPSSSKKEEILESKMEMKIKVYSKDENSFIYETPEKKFGLTMNGSVREKDVAVRGRDRDELSKVALTRAIKHYIDNFIMETGQFYRMEKAKTPEK